MGRAILRGTRRRVGVRASREAVAPKTGVRRPSPVPGIYPFDHEHWQPFLSEQNEQDLRERIDEARTEARAYVEDGRATQSHDAALPDDFADRLIMALKVGILHYVTSASDAAGKYPTAAEVKRIAAVTAKQRGALQVAQEALDALAPERTALAEIEGGGRAAGAAARLEHEQVKTAIAKAIAYLDDKIPRINIARDTVSSGTRPNFWLNALKVELASWWRRQGLTPTDTPSGAYQSVLKILVRARDSSRLLNRNARKKGPAGETLRFHGKGILDGQDAVEGLPERKNLRVREALRLTAPRAPKGKPR